MSTNEEHFNNFIKQELDKTIAGINEYNNDIDITDMLTYFNSNQKDKFVYLVKQYYLKLDASLKNKTNEGLIKYDEGTETFIIPIVDENPDGTTKTINYKLTIEQFLLAIIRALVVAVFRLERNVFFITWDDNTSILTDDTELENIYSFIISFILNEMLRDPEFALKLTELSNDIGAVGLLVNPNFRPTDSTTYEVTGDLPRPPTPPGGWPSDNRPKLGGKTNRKRKYKSKSKSRRNSKSKKRRYKSRSNRRSKRKNK